MDWFATRLLGWFDQHGRKDLPWQQDPTPYRVWVSEIMLQQTQVSTVVPYFQRFMARYPDVADLAAADLDEVLHHWTGLGYYARARNLHRAARQVMERHGGHFPRSAAELEELPGIGRSTAGAIAAIAGSERAAILDGNVKRVLARFHALSGYPGQAAVARALWAHAETHTPTRRVADYTQAIMDLGATLCTRTRPACERCPVAARCQARAAGDPARFPWRKPRAAKPVRAARLVLFVDACGRCLLEQRPATGIWGGLWNPPERAADADPAAVAREFGLVLQGSGDTHRGAPFRHTFTHFHLDIEPVYVRAPGAPAVIEDRSDLRWYDPLVPDPIGLSAPAAKLLAGLPSQLEEFTLT
ncbi:MAG: A/G-specific adenine glycosylase [Pseudomonadales bacterium]